LSTVSTLGGHGAPRGGKRVLHPQVHGLLHLGLVAFDHPEIVPVVLLHRLGQFRTEQAGIDCNDLPTPRALTQQAQQRRQFAATPDRLLGQHGA
jgi:hypothetical protein